MPNVTITRNIPVDAPTLWPLIGDLRRVADFHPTIDHVEILSESVEGEGAARRCHFKDGTSVVERVSAYQPGRSVDLELSEFAMPMKSMAGRLAAESIDDHSTRVSMSLEYQPKFGALGSLMNVLMIRPMMKRLVRQVLAGLDVEARRIASAEVDELQIAAA